MPDRELLAHREIGDQVGTALRTLQLRPREDELRQQLVEFEGRWLGLEHGGQLTQPVLRDAQLVELPRKRPGLLLGRADVRDDAGRTMTPSGRAPPAWSVP